MSIKLVNEYSLEEKKKPREKILQHGIESLDDSELLATIFGTGYRGLDVIELSKHLISNYGNKGILQFDSFRKVQQETGLPLVKSCQILAMAEYFRRVYRKDDVCIKSSEQLYEYLKNDLIKLSYERLVIVCTDAQRRVLYSGIIAQGESNTLQVSLASIFHHPFRLNIKHFFLAHNHPQGSCSASQDDIAFTACMKEESEKFGLSFDDHIIIGEEGFYSFALKGFL
ncbi:DNA repair protein RadC [Candidatus Peregrinibacteria bacterium]|jgi:DNA repair protein RadC|nr:DNA repair protein RadC [Candidatus Peregrinibacteria bacterium]